jgi:uncharacterized small protein (TIGR04563 family)
MVPPSEDAVDLQQTMMDPTVAGKPRSSSDRRKQCLYFSAEMLSEIASEAARQDRSLSWIVQKDWKAARRAIKRAPSVNDPPPPSTRR